MPYLPAWTDEVSDALMDAFLAVQRDDRAAALAVIHDAQERVKDVDLELRTYVSRVRTGKPARDHDRERRKRNLRLIRTERDDEPQTAA